MQLEYIGMYAGCLRNGARKHYNMIVVCIAQNILACAHNIFCMSGAMGDSRTVHTIYIRWDKLDSQFIVDACIDFQTFSKIFRFHILML